MTVPRAARPPRRRWTSFVADSGAETTDTDRVRSLHEDGHPDHRVRVEHDASTVLIHLSDEEGPGWTVFAVERATRRTAVADGRTQAAAAQLAYRRLYPS